MWKDPRQQSTNARTGARYRQWTICSHGRCLKLFCVVCGIVNLSGRSENLSCFILRGSCFHFPVSWKNEDIKDSWPLCYSGAYLCAFVCNWELCYSYRVIATSWTSQQTHVVCTRVSVLDHLWLDLAPPLAYTIDSSAHFTNVPHPPLPHHLQFFSTVPTWFKTTQLVVSLVTTLTFSPNKCY